MATISLTGADARKENRHFRLVNEYGNLYNFFRWF